jgi:hypothetical protein
MSKIKLPAGNKYTHEMLSRVIKENGGSVEISEEGLWTTQAPADAGFSRRVEYYVRCACKKRFPVKNEGACSPPGALLYRPFCCSTPAGPVAVFSPLRGRLEWLIIRRDLWDAGFFVYIDRHSMLVVVRPARAKDPEPPAMSDEELRREYSELMSSCIY